MTAQILAYVPAGSATPAWGSGDARKIADLARDAARIAYRIPGTDGTDVGPFARDRIRASFLEILDRCEDSVERTDLMTRACAAIVADALHPDAPLGMAGSLSVRLACLHYLAERAKETRGMPGLASRAPALAVAWAMRTSAKRAYLAGEKLWIDERAMVRIDPDVELLLPMTNPARQALYRADAEA